MVRCIKNVFFQKFGTCTRDGSFWSSFWSSFLENIVKILFVDYILVYVKRFESFYLDKLYESYGASYFVGNVS